MSIKRPLRSRRRPELFLMIGGAGLLVAFFAADLWGQIERAEGIAQFTHKQETVAATPDAADATNQPAEQDAALALLRIPKVRLVVPVYAGTDESVLRRGAGLIEGTARPGARGNIGIAAHRDRDFRPLQHVTVGDVIELETPSRIHAYQVTELSVVEPADVHVLDDDGEAVLTLVTCFPFYFVGNAPNRFIVRAVAVDGFL